MLPLMMNPHQTWLEFIWSQVEYAWDPDWAERLMDEDTRQTQGDVIASQYPI